MTPIHFHSKVMTLRANEYGPVYKERIATNQSVVVSDPFEYAKVIKVDGKYPHRVELAPMAFYKKKRGYILGLVNEWVSFLDILVFSIEKVDNKTCCYFYTHG